MLLRSLWIGSANMPDQHVEKMSGACRSDDASATHRAVIAPSSSRVAIRELPVLGARTLRLVVLFTAVVAGIGALGTFAFVRLAGTLEQLHAIDVAPASASGVASPPSRAIAPQSSSEPAEIAEVAEVAAPVADSGDEQIKAWLVADAEFQRAASELLNDPDPKVQEEARALLRDLGVSQAGRDQ
jgi:hypothetical protein